MDVISLNGCFFHRPNATIYFLFDEIEAAVKKAYRYRFYPTDEQKVVLAQTFGCCRFVYNYFLHRKKELWEKEEKNLSYIECSKALTFLKQEHLWLKEVSSVCLQQCLRHLQGAFEGFFKKRARFPRYKKKDQHQSCAFMQNAFTYKNRILTLAKMGPLEVRWSQEFTGTPTSLTVSKDSADR